LTSRTHPGSQNVWLGVFAGLTLLQVAASFLPISTAQRVTTSDLVQFSVIALSVVGALLNLPRTRGHARGFWALLALSSLMTAADYAIWAWYEVVLHVSMPRVHPGDMLLVLHIAPILMGLALLPHSVRRGEDVLTTFIDFSVVGCWWVYLYLQFTFVWQFLSYDADNFHRAFNLLYRSGLGILICALFFAHRAARGAWRAIYRHYLIAFAIYAPTSWTINILIQHHHYASGGPMDVPLTASLAYIAWVGFGARTLDLRQAQSESDAPEGFSLPFWLSGAAALSVPAISLVSHLATHAVAPVRHFRVILDFSAVLILTALVIGRQQLLNLRLRKYLNDSQQGYESLSRLQEQVVQSEKLASIGRLVSGAAHELNNPLAAILGYSELLAVDEELPAKQRGFAEKIGQQARRTKNLVSSLLSFARQSTPLKRLTDLNGVVSQAYQLRLASLPPNIRVVRELQPDILPVMADDNHLLQVVLHVFNNAVQAVEEVGSGEIVVRTRMQDEYVALEISDTGRGISDPMRVFDPFYTTKPLGRGAGLGLSACYGIVQQHDGKIEAVNLRPNGALFRILLPAAIQDLPTERKPAVQ
jgi:signal transduction histidine kinase